MMKLNLPGMRRINDRLWRYAYRFAGLRWHLSSGVFVEVANPIEWIIYNDIFADGDYDVPLTELLERKTDRPLTVADLGASRSEKNLTLEPTSDFSRFGWHTLPPSALLQIKSTSKESKDAGHCAT